MDWMAHINYLQAVADGDVQHIKEKEATYQGSWKRSGGRSAWFMLRRKIDRMLEMLKKPDPPHGFSLTNLNDVLDRVIDPAGDAPIAVTLVQHLRDVYVSEDIFLKIEDDPWGRDGSVLAEVRDLRRYLTLVEAEMMARGVIPITLPSAPSKTATPPPQKERPRSSGPITSMEIDPIGPEVRIPGTPEDGGHHATQSEKDHYSEEMRKEQAGWPDRNREGEY